MAEFDCLKCVTFCQVRADWERKTREVHASAIEQAIAAAAAAASVPQPPPKAAPNAQPHSAAAEEGASTASKSANPPNIALGVGQISLATPPKSKPSNPKAQASVAPQPPQPAGKPAGPVPFGQRGPSPPPGAAEDHFMKIRDCGNEREFIEQELRNKLPGFKYCSLNKNKKVRFGLCLR